MISGVGVGKDGNIGDVELVYPSLFVLFIYLFYDGGGVVVALT